MNDYLYFIVLVLFLVSFIVQLYFITVVHGRLRGYKSRGRDEGNDVKYPVSVIICGRNEEKNLENNLPAILEQEYPSFEVVVVNDCSSDDSDLVLRRYEAKYPHLKIVTLNEHARFKHGKKFAVTMGIKAASNEYLLFTDADCRPASPHWIDLMQRNFSGGKKIVLGYSPYISAKGLLNALIRFETFHTALSYLSFALGGDPYMGVGRNLAYTRSLFFANKGFASHMHIPSGDDDLFINETATSENTAIEIHPDSRMWSEPKRTFGAYWKQKVRHMGAGKAYKTRHKRALSFLTGSALLFYLSLAVLVVLNTQWWLLLGAYLIRLICQLIVYFPSMKKLGYKSLIWGLPALDLIGNLFIIAVSMVSLLKKNIQWK